jgi:L-lactate dehydrogenase (cytochrome)
MIVNIGDLRKIAKRRVPRAVFGYIDGGAEDERTMRANVVDFARYTFRPRMLVDVANRDISTTVLGQKLPTPLILAPTGLCGMAAPRGEVLAARAAINKGALFTLSSMSSVSMEDVMAEAPGPKWFQLYVWRDRELTRTLIERAREAGYGALVVTVDVQVIGQRERDLRTGATVPPKITLANVVDAIPKLPWFVEFARKQPKISFANVAGTAGELGDRVMGIGAFVANAFDPSVTWDDIDWFRSIWRGPMLIKGIMSAEDARIAVDQHGIEGIIVSNHGGRQLDSLPSAVAVLPEVVDAVGDRADVIIDGGIRRGTDIIKSIALGAKAVMAGRPYVYGLAAGGQAGCEMAIEILLKELDRNLGLLGCPNLAELDRSYLRLSGQYLPG